MVVTYSIIFRELPGFGSTRLLLSTVAEELDSWRSQIEDTISILFESYAKVGQELADKLTIQVSLLLVLHHLKLFHVS